MRKKSYAVASVIAALVWSAASLGQSQAPAAGQAPAAMNSPTVKVGAAMAAKAAAPSPSATAQNQSQQTSIGKGQTKVNASGPSGYWTDLVDIDDDGMVEDNQFLLDKKRGILYTYRYDDFQCADGTSENGDVLMAIYAQGNPTGMPVGSGWFVVGLAPGQCGEKKGGTYGCKFNANGKLGTCGLAKIREESGELEITVKKR